MRKILLFTRLLVVLLSCEGVKPMNDAKSPCDFDWKFALNDHQGAEQPGFAK